LKPVRLSVIKRGRVIARTPARVSELLIEGRARLVDGSVGFAPET
jgi:cytosine/creatinine deaminase